MMKIRDENFTSNYKKRDNKIEIYLLIFKQALNILKDR